MTAPPKFPVPDWITNAEFTYGFRPQEDFRAQAEQQGLILPTFSRSVGLDPEVIKRYHDLGIKTMNYISFSIRMLDPEEKKERGLCLGRTPEMAIYDERSLRKRCIFADSTDMRRIEICPNCPQVVDALMEEVRMYMEAGLDGLFLDHACGVSKCYGAEFGIHDHIYSEDDIKDFPEEYLKFVPGQETPTDDALGNYAYAMALARAQQVIREYGEDKALNLNTTYWPFYYSPKPIRKFVMYMPKVLRIVPEVLWENAESVMVESHVIITDRFISSESNKGVTMRWGNFQDWLKLDQTPKKYEKQGKRTLALPYFGSDVTPDDLFYCYAIAKLQNLIWETSPASPAARFCTFLLGKPLGEDYGVQEGIYYRPYEKGLVAVNPQSKALSTEVEVPEGKVHDFYAEKDLTTPGGKLTVQLPPESGRVYLYR